MCEYCKLETLNANIGEKSNGCKTIGKIKDGSQIFETYLERYVVESEGVRNTYMGLELGVGIDRCEYSVKTERIQIKYCPFCGEEL